MGKYARCYRGGRSAEASKQQLKVFSSYMVSFRISQQMYRGRKPTEYQYIYK
jgi:hypothetical protein